MTLPHHSFLAQNIEQIMRVCVELNTVIHAQYHVAATIPPMPERPKIYIEFENYFHNTIRSKSIELSVNFRHMNERLEEARQYVTFRERVSPIGAVGRSLCDQKKPLSLHDCCNKIIHCKRFDFVEARYQTFNPESNLKFENFCWDSEVVIFGDLRGNSWSCKIDLQILAEHVYAVLEGWINNDFDNF